MARLNITGQVRYLDTTPAAQAVVTIVEVDGLPGGANDRILVRTTDLDGRFAGRSADWQDREGTVPVLGTPIPDVMLLTFTAAVDGRSHDGPFLLDGSRSAPIILPWLPPKPVAKADRELVQIIVLSQDYVGAERLLYQFIETSAQAATQTILGGSYNRITFLKGPAATLAGFVATLGAAAGRTGVEAVDVIFTTHGTTNAMVFADGVFPESQVRVALLDLPAARRRKLRVIFSTACIGETHLDTWIAAGFNEASGSAGIYADSAVSFGPFLATWAAERSFAEAVDAANAADPLNIADNAARAFYRARGQRSTAGQIDSDRVRSGGGRTRIYTTP